MPILGSDGDNNFSGRITMIDLHVDVDAIVKTVLGGANHRNDLVAILENGVQMTLNTEFAVHHGNLANTDGSNSVPPPGPTQTVPYTFAVGVEAAGAGSNLYMHIESGENTWGVIIGCPPNKQNYFKYNYSPSRVDKTRMYNATDSTRKYYANNGTQPFYAPDTTVAGTRVDITLTNVSPATAQIQFLSV
jgi:hypothetical protein